MSLFKLVSFRKSRAVIKGRGVEIADRIDISGVCAGK